MVYSSKILGCYWVASLSSKQTTSAGKCCAGPLVVFRSESEWGYLTESLDSIEPFHPDVKLTQDSDPKICQWHGGKDDAGGLLDCGGCDYQDQHQEVRQEGDCDYQGVYQT